MEHALHPHIDDPAAFITRLRPCGVPSDITKRLEEAKNSDPYCKRVRSRLAEYESGRQSAVNTDDGQGAAGRVPLSVGEITGKPAGNAGHRWAAKRARRYLEQQRKTGDEFRVGEDGARYHQGETRRGLLCLERVMPLAFSRGDRRRQREAHGEQGCTRVGRRVFEPWVSESPWAGALARAAEYHVA